MKSAAEWFDRYGESHQHPLNKAIHWLCIPVIVVATLGLLQSVPHPFGAQPFLHWGSIVVALSLAFYLRLSLTLGGGMALVSAAALVVNGLLAAGGVLLPVSVGAFALAWLVQFIGHKIEGKKPSFFEDLQFLLIGPAWLLQFVYRQVGIPVERRARDGSLSTVR